MANYGITDKVYEYMEKNRGESYCIHQIAESVNLKPEQISTSLTALESQGYVKHMHKHICRAETGLRHTFYGLTTRKRIPRFHKLTERRNYTPIITNTATAKIDRKCIPVDEIAEKIGEKIRNEGQYETEATKTYIEELQKHIATITEENKQLKRLLSIEWGN